MRGLGPPSLAATRRRPAVSPNARDRNLAFGEKTGEAPSGGCALAVNEAALPANPLAPRPSMIAKTLARKASPRREGTEMSKNTWRVAVVGAGFSGLISARELERLGHEVEVIEARDRIGGRTWTDERMGFTLEMGGTWVHWMQPYVWSEVIRYGQTIYPSPIVDQAYWITGGEVRTGTEAEMDAKISKPMEKIFERAREFFPYPHDPLYVLNDPDTPQETKDRFRAADKESVLDILRDGTFTQEDIDLADGYWRAAFQGETATASALMALHWAALSDHRLSLLDDQTLRYKLHHGMKGIYDKIAADVRGRIRLSTVVSKVERDDDGATLTLADGTTERYDAVVVTIPVGALGNVEFEPALPANIQQVVKDKWGCVGSKYWIKLKGHHNLFGYAPVGHPIAVFRSEYFLDDDTTICVGFGPDHAALDVTDIAAVDAVVKQWNPELEAVDAVMHDWVADEWSGQTWTTPKTGQFVETRWQDLGEDRLVLAGSDWANGWNSFVDGAIETGFRAALAVDGAANAR